MPQELDVFRPRQRDQRANPFLAASVEKPARRRVINAHHIEADLPHLREIATDLFRRADVESFCIRLERPVGHALNEELAIAVEEKLRDCADARLGGHSAEARRANYDRPVAGAVLASVTSTDAQMARNAARITSAVRARSSRVCAVD